VPAAIEPTNRSHCKSPINSICWATKRMLAYSPLPAAAATRRSIFLITVTLLHSRSDQEHGAPSLAGSRWDPAAIVNRGIVEGTIDQNRTIIALLGSPFPHKHDQLLSGIRVRESLMADKKFLTPEEVSER